MKVYIMISKTGTWLSRILGFLSGFKYMHSSISLDPTLNEMYSFGRIKPHNPLIGGFVKESLYSGVYTFSPKNECMVYSTTITHEQAEILISEIKRFEMSSQAYHYNFLGLFFIPFRIKVKRKHHYFCSQFITELFIKVAILDQNIKSYWTSPKDLIHLLDLNLEYAGLIKDYPLKPAGKK
jgi:hypothetical protein